MSFRWCSEFVRTGCVLPPLAMLPARHFAERAGGAEKTRDLETDLRQFFAGTADPLLVLDSSLRVSAINAAACRVRSASLVTPPESSTSMPVTPSCEPGVAPNAAPLRRRANAGLGQAHRPL